MTDRLHFLDSSSARRVESSINLGRINTMLVDGAEEHHSESLPPRQGFSTDYLCFISATSSSLHCSRALPDPTRPDPPISTLEFAYSLLRALPNPIMTDLYG